MDTDRHSGSGGWVRQDDSRTGTVQALKAFLCSEGVVAPPALTVAAISGQPPGHHPKMHPPKQPTEWLSRKHNTWAGRKLLCGGGGGEAHFPNPPPPWPP